MVRYGCSECKPEIEVKGIFAFLYYAGTGNEIKHLDIEHRYLPPNVLLCSRHIELIPRELFVANNNFLMNMNEAIFLGFMKGEGFYRDDTFEIKTLTPPSLLTIESARKQFPGAVKNIESRLQKDEEERIRRELPAPKQLN